MQARYVHAKSLEELLNPTSPLWRQQSGELLPLTGTPLGLQPTVAIRVSWANRRIGVVERVESRVLHNGQYLLFHLEWEDATENRAIDDITSFPDAAGVLFPLVPEAPLALMGARGAPVNVWYWRADENVGRHVVAEGLGTTRTIDQSLVKAQGTWSGGRWQVVIARALRVDTSEPVVQLVPGSATRFSVAIWDGANQERAGIKSFSPRWVDLTLAATN